jgi:hypothetical protein
MEGWVLPSGVGNGREFVISDGQGLTGGFGGLKRE